LVRFDSSKVARSAYDYLLSRGVITRMMGGYGLPDSLRFTIGLGSELEKVIDDLSAYRKLL
jgi:histidinol-phosphate aminotransferase